MSPQPTTHAARLLARWGLTPFTTLHWALALSVGLHSVLLSVRFVAPEAFNRVFQDTPLEVVLVNARSQEAPDKAQAIAQSNLAGGGEAASGRATSPLPNALQMRTGEADDNTDEQRIEAMKAQQTLLLAQIRQQLAQYTPTPPDAPAANPAQAERERQRQQLVKLLAEIEKRVNEENARPRKRYISPATREEVYALYYDGLRRRIEDHGTTHFPQAAGKKLYGELTMVITVNHDGRVLATEVAQTSGQLLLDRRAQAIVRALSFGSFSDTMRRRADQIVVVSRFRFTREETLNTTLTSQ
jgi:protein TonB